MTTFTGRSRVEAALAGEQADRVPFSVWTHLPKDDLSAERLTDRTIEMQRALGLDFIKSMPNAYFCGEDWGLVADASPVLQGGMAKVVQQPVKTIDDWSKIRALDVRQGALGRELRHLKAVVDAVGPDIPVLATAFAPTTIARKIAGPQYKQHLADKPKLVEGALAEITGTTRNFVREALQAGCAGVYLAVQEAADGAMTTAEYRQTGIPSDLEVLAASKDAWFNVLHIHGKAVHFDLLEHYPVQAISWHAEDSEPSTRAYAARKGRKAIIGGIPRTSFTGRDIVKTAGHVKEALSATGGKGLILSPTCTVHYPFDMDFVAQVMSLVTGLEKRN